MNEITIAELMELLENKMRDREESITTVRNQIIELEKRLQHLEGNLYEINYLIDYIENEIV